MFQSHTHKKKAFGIDQTSMYVYMIRPENVQCQSQIKVGPFISVTQRATFDTPFPFHRAWLLTGTEK